MKQLKCMRCGAIKPVSEFGSNSTSSTGYQSYCRNCKNENRAKQMKVNVEFKIRHHFHTRMTSTLADVPEDLYANMEKYLGYKLKALVRSLDKQCREDYGFNLRKALGDHGYHIDHVVPLSVFDNSSADSEAFRACWGIDNLKCITAEENLAKGAKIIV